MDENTVSYIKFLKEVIPTPDPDPAPVIDPAVYIPDTSSASQFLNQATALPKTGDPGWWALMAAIVFAVITIVLAISFVLVPAVAKFRQSSVNEPKFKKSNAVILISFALVALLSCGFYFSQIMSANADDIKAKVVYATGQVECTLGASGQSWSPAQLINKYDTELVLLRLETEAIDEQLEGIPLSISYGDTVLFEGKIGDKVELTHVLQLQANETVNLTYSIPGEIDYDSFPFGYNVLRVAFFSAESAVKDLVVNDIMYYPVMNADDSRWEQIRWYNTEKNMVYGVHSMEDIVANNIRYYSVDYPKDTTFKGIRVEREGFAEAFGNIDNLPEEAGSSKEEPAPPVTEYVGTNMYSGETCETLSFNQPITSGEPLLNGVPISSADSAYGFSTKNGENYYWSALPAFKYSKYKIGTKLPKGTRIDPNTEIAYDSYAYYNLGWTIGLNPEPSKKVWCTREGKSLDSTFWPTPKFWSTTGYAVFLGAETTPGRIPVCPDAPESFTDGGSKDAAVFEDAMITTQGTGQYFTKKWAYAWPVNRNPALIWGDETGYAWLRMEGDSTFDTNTIFQYMNDTARDNSDGPDKNNALVVFSRTFGAV